MSARKSIRAGCLQEPQYTRSSMSLQIQQRFREISQMPVYFNLPYKGHFNSSLKWKGVGRFISLASDLMCLQFLLRAMEFFKLWGFWCRALSGSQNERKWFQRPWEALGRVRSLSAQEGLPWGKKLSFRCQEAQGTPRDGGNSLGRTVNSSKLILSEHILFSGPTSGKSSQTSRLA